MDIIMPVSYYKGSDGSSMTETRCAQTVLLHSMLNDMTDQPTTYKEIQVEAEKRKLFGDTKAQSAIRTFFPLLLKLGFTQIYDGIHPKDVFTKEGEDFVIAITALQKASQIGDSDIKKDLIRINQTLLQRGIVYWFNHGSEKEHNLWLALDLFGKLEVLEWNEFLYAIYLWHSSVNLDDIIKELIQNRNNGVTYSFANTDGEKLPSTSYCYIRALLEEAGIIEKINPSTDKVTVDGINFINNFE